MLFINSEITIIFTHDIYISEEMPSLIQKKGATLSRFGTNASYWVNNLKEFPLGQFFCQKINILTLKNWILIYVIILTDITVILYIHIINY